MLLGGVATFFSQNVKGMYASEQRMRLAGQMKKFTDELIVHASRSNQFVIFKSPAYADFDTPATDRQVIDASASPLLHPGGDFVLFIYYEIPKPANLARYRINSLVGYYLTTGTAGGTGSLQKIEITPTTPSTSTPEAILAACWNSLASKFITGTPSGYTVTVTSSFPLVRGLALPEIVDNVAVSGPTTPRLFYVTAARNVMVSGQVYTSSKDIATGDWKTYTDSFFFNITPRT